MGIREYALIVCYLLICAIIVALCYLMSYLTYQAGAIIFQRIRKKIEIKKQKKKEV